MSTNKPPLLETLSWIDAFNGRSDLQQSILDNLESSQVKKARKERRIRREGSFPLLNNGEEVNAGEHAQEHKKNVSPEKEVSATLSTSFDDNSSDEKPTTASLAPSMIAISKKRMGSWKQQFPSSRSMLSNLSTADTTAQAAPSRRSSRTFLTSAASTHDGNVSCKSFVEQTSLENNPVNILCFDGGGSKGYANIEMHKILEEICVDLKLGGDYVSRFDLVAGTSVGGTGALICSISQTTNDSSIKSSMLLDKCTDEVFSNISLPRLLHTGVGAEKDKDVLNTSRRFIGEEKMLLNDSNNGIKSFALCVCRDINEEEVTGEVSRKKKSNGVAPSTSNRQNAVKPFLLRTYNHPNKTDENYYEGSSELKLFEAMGATSAAPGAFDRVKVSIDGKSKLLADGGLCFNCPIPIALCEALSLWPNRRIGTVLSVGLDPTEDALALRAIDSVRLNNPNLYYQRIIVPGISEFKSLETNKEKIFTMKKTVRDYMYSPLVRERLNLVLEKLFDSPSRRNNKTTMPTEEKVDKSIIDGNNTKIGRLPLILSYVFCCRSSSSFMTEAKEEKDTTPDQEESAQHS